MPLDVLLFAVFAALGLLAQRRDDAERVRRAVWTANYWIAMPAAAVYAFLTLELDAGLLGAAACGIGAWWTTLGLGWLYGRAAGRRRSERGALTMIAAFPNTGFVGFPLAHLAFGTEGLALAVLYDQLSMIVPAIVVSNIIARAHAHPATTAPSRNRLLREVLLNPPLWAVAGALVARVWMGGPTGSLDWLGSLVGHAVGPIGFFLLGVSLPLQRFVHSHGDIRRMAGAVAIRLVGAPAVLWVWGALAGVEIPGAFYLVAAMPVAFHVLVITRLHGIEPALVRSAVVVSTLLAVTAVVLGASL